MFSERPFPHVTPLPILSDVSILADDLTLSVHRLWPENHYSEPRLENHSSGNIVQDVWYLLPVDCVLSFASQTA